MRALACAADACRASGPSASARTPLTLRRRKPPRAPRLRRSRSASPGATARLRRRGEARPRQRRAGSRVPCALPRRLPAASARPRRRQGQAAAVAARPADASDAERGMARCVDDLSGRRCRRQRHRGGHWRPRRPRDWPWRRNRVGATSWSMVRGTWGQPLGRPRGVQCSSRVAAARKSPWISGGEWRFASSSSCNAFRRRTRRRLPRRTLRHGCAPRRRARRRSCGAGRRCGACRSATPTRRACGLRARTSC